MNKAIKERILQKIKDYNRIIICRHRRPDGDAIGSTKGLAEILKLSYPEKEIYVINSDYSDYLEFLGGEDEDIADELYSDALVIVLDTGNVDRISNKKYSLGKELIKIDHHIDIAPYGDISWVEDNRSSICEMIADFYVTFKGELKINSYAATCIYTGMVTDSGRFRFESVSGDTMRLAGEMLECGIDTDKLYAHLYLKDFDFLKFQAYVFNKMKITKNGVAYLNVPMSMQKKFKLTEEQASSVISFLDSIKGCIVWLAFIENQDKSIRVRLRSRFVTINSLAEKYHGGGHACAAGSTVYSKKEAEALIEDADSLVRDYKQNNGGWL